MTGQGEHPGEVVAVSGLHRVVDCTVCEFKHVVPLPTEGEQQRLYTQQFYERDIPDYIKRYDEDRWWWELTYTRRLTSVENLRVSRGRALDIGCGPGIFAQTAAERGWTVTGIEPGRAACDYATKTMFKRGFVWTLLDGTLEDAALTPHEKFGIVHMHEVLEHAPNPRAMLLRAHDLLADDGLLVVCVPNDFSPLQDMAVKAKPERGQWWVQPRHHLNYFDLMSLQELLIDCDFAIRVREMTFPMELFLLMGRDYVGNDDIGRMCHRERMEFERSMHQVALTDFYETNARLGIGREIVMYARKA